MFSFPLRVPELSKYILHVAVLVFHGSQYDINGINDWTYYYTYTESGEPCGSSLPISEQSRNFCCARLPAGAKERHPFWVFFFSFVSSSRIFSLSILFGELNIIRKRLALGDNRKV